MAERSFFKKNIDELEQLFAANPNDKKLMKKLISELKHRKTPRAKMLRVKISEHQESAAILSIPADPAIAFEEENNLDEQKNNLWDSIAKVISNLKH